MELEVRSTIAGGVPMSNGIERKSAIGRREHVLPAERKAGVLLVGNFLSGSVGTRGACEELALQLEDLNWLRVLTTSSKPHRIPRLVDMLATIWNRRNDFQVAQVDVYSGPAFFWAEVTCAALRKLGKPYILVLHGGNLPTFARRSPQRIRRLLQSARVVTTPSEYLREQMADYHDDLRLLPNALDLSAYRFRLRRRPRQSLVWLRAFHEIYNPTLVPQVMRLLAPDYPDLQMIMIGPNKADGSLDRTRELAAKLGVLNRLSLPGGVPKEETPCWLDKGDIFLNTPNVDNTPVSVLEAMATGLCVVSTNVGGLPYLLRDAEDALLVAPNSPEAMAAAVRRILTQPRLAERLSRNAREKATRHDWGVVLPQWEQLLKSLCPTNGHSPVSVSL
jgi:glycosyltransferase involved in cell wall biosynthesis